MDCTALDYHSFLLERETIHPPFLSFAFFPIQKAAAAEEGEVWRLFSSRVPFFYFLNSIYLYPVVMFLLYWHWHILFCSCFFLLILH